MNILIVNSAEEGVTDFVSPIVRILEDADTNSDTIQYSDIPTTDISKYDGVILSASPIGNDIVDIHIKFYQWIKDYNKPILGICAGHQLIGKLYGSELRRNIEREDGNFEVYIKKDDLIFDGFKEKFLVTQHHNDSISLPDEFILLARSDKCKVQVMKHKSKPIYTTQFHAEILNKDLILNFINIVNSSKN